MDIWHNIDNDDISFSSTKTRPTLSKFQDEVTLPINDYQDRWKGLDHPSDKNETWYTFLLLRPVQMVEYILNLLPASVLIHSSSNLKVYVRNLSNWRNELTYNSLAFLLLFPNSTELKLIDLKCTVHNIYAQKNMFQIVKLHFKISKLIALINLVFGDRSNCKDQ